MPLLDLPEEILFLILESAILPSDPRLSLPDSQSLLACRTIHRVGLPILYQNILLRSISQVESVERTILSQPKLVCHIRNLYSLPLVSWLPVFRAIGDAKGSLQTLDFVFHVSLGRSQFLFDWENVGSTISAVPVRRLVVRQGQGFLQDRALIASRALARAVDGWPGLVRLREPCLSRDIMLIIIKQTGSRHHPTPPAIRTSASQPTVPPRVGVVPLPVAARFAHPPPPDVESVLTRCQREPQPGPHCVHRAPNIIEPERCGGDGRSSVHRSTPRAT
jgi:hypothetical protein